MRLAVQSTREKAKRLSDLNRESARTVPAALPVLPRPPLISIIESEHTNSSSGAILVSGINLNTNNDNSSSAGSKRGRPLGAINKEPSIRTCKNCQFYLDFEGAKVCPGKMTSTGCAKERHPSYEEFLKKDQSRKDKIAESRKKIAPTTAEITAIATANVMIDIDEP